MLVYVYTDPTRYVSLDFHASFLVVRSTMGKFKTYYQGVTVRLSEHFEFLQHSLIRETF